jgi:hypothetical protein
MVRDRIGWVGEWSKNGVQVEGNEGGTHPKMTKWTEEISCTCNP